MTTIKRRLPGTAAAVLAKEKPEKHVLGYVRVSTEEQRKHGFSLGDQEKEIYQECLRRFGDGNFLLHFERDEGRSGSLDWRPPTRGRRAYREGLARIAERLAVGG